MNKAIKKHNIFQSCVLAKEAFHNKLLTYHDKDRTEHPFSIDLTDWEALTEFYYNFRHLTAGVYKSRATYKIFYFEIPLICVPSFNLLTGICDTVNLLF